jgi:hypothetical protein
MNITDVTPKQLRKAANVQEKIQSLQHELNQILGHEVPTPLTGTARKSKRRMSAAGRRAIGAGARARWAKIKGTKPKRKMSAKGLANIRAGVAKRMKNKWSQATTRPKRRISAAGRARLSALAKERWKNAKAAGKGRL